VYPHRVMYMPLKIAVGKASRPVPLTWLLPKRTRTTRNRAASPGGAASDFTIHSTALIRMDGNSVPHGCIIAMCWVRGLRIGLDRLSHRQHTAIIDLDRLRMGLDRLAVRHTRLLHRLRISLLHRLRISLLHRLRTSLLKRKAAYKACRLAIACECCSMYHVCRRIGHSDHVGLSREDGDLVGNESWLGREIIPPPCPAKDGYEEEDTK